MFVNDIGYYLYVSIAIGITRLVPNILKQANKILKMFKPA